MPHFFIPLRDDETPWGAVTADPAGAYLSCDDQGMPIVACERGSRDFASVLRTDTDLTGEMWVLIAHRPQVRINDVPVIAGIAVLADRDEVRMPNAKALYFSAEQVAEVRPYCGPDDARCPRCRREFSTGTPAVRCPQCRTWFHHVEDSDADSCWACKKTCSICDHGTAVGNGLEWVPTDV